VPQFCRGRFVALVAFLGLALVATSLTPLASPAAASPQRQSIAMAPDGPVKDPKWPKRIGWKGCPAPQWPTALNTGEPGQGRRVLIIGDSLTRDSRKRTIQELRASGWTPTVRCWGGKRLDWASAQIARAKKLDQLPGVVVLAFGTNDMRWISRSVTEQRVEQVLDQLGPNRSVLWVNTLASPWGGDRFSRAKQRWFNRMLERVAKKHPNLQVLDWAAFGLANKVRFSSSLHLDARGNRLRAKFVTDQVNAIAP